MAYQTGIHFRLVGPLHGWRYVWAEFRLWFHLLQRVAGVFRGEVHRRCVLDTDDGTYLWCDVCNGHEDQH